MSPESAFDPDHPYYDEKSTRDNPKWHLVHVTFTRKFPEMITLKELQKFSKEGGVLENMQALRRTRLSVSKVTKKEWGFILSLVDEEDEKPASVAEPEVNRVDEAKTNGVLHDAAETNGEKPVPTEAKMNLV